MRFANRLGRSLRPLLLSGASLAVSLGGVEVLARMVSPGVADEAIPKQLAHAVLFEPDPQLGRIPRSLASFTIWSPEWQSHVSINALGMRGPRPERTPANGARVLVLGDSLTFGMQVDDADTFARRLEVDLTRTRPTSVWNAGVDGYGTFDALGRAQRELERGLQFDAIVLTLFLGNDLSDNAKERPPHTARRRQAGTPAPTVHERASKWVSLVWAHLLFERWRSGHEETFARQVALDFEPWCDDDALEAVLPKTLVAVDALRSLARTHNASLVLALAPPQWVVDPTLGAETADWLGLEGFDPSRVPDRLRAELHPAISVVDLTEPLRRAAQDGPVSYRFDGHWNPRGHAVVADAIAPVLRDLLQPRDDETAPAGTVKPSSRLRD